MIGNRGARSQYTQLALWLLSNMWRNIVQSRLIQQTCLNRSRKHCSFLLKIQIIIMDYNIKFVETLKAHPNPQQILQAALDVILQEKNYQENLSQYKDNLTRKDKILVSRWTKVLKEFAIRPKQEVQQTLERLGKIDASIADIVKNQILPSIYFDRKLNNYCFIKFFTDPENSRPKLDDIVETQQKPPLNISSFESDFAKLEWKLEITLSTIKMKKVVRPLILLIIHTKSGEKKSLYLDSQQFQEFRKNVALALKNIHLVESISQ